MKSEQIIDDEVKDMSKDDFSEYIKDLELVRRKLYKKYKDEMPSDEKIALEIEEEVYRKMKERKWIKTH